MILNPVGKQWANIVKTFEESEKIQRHYNSGCWEDVDDYNSGRLRVLEVGLALAKKQHRSVRFKFWMKPHTSTNMILTDFLLALKEFVQAEEYSHRSEMTMALDAWMGWLNMVDPETRSVRDRIRVPASH